MDRRVLLLIRSPCLTAMLCAAVLGLVGCASDSVKRAVASVQTSSIAYGAVMEVRPANTSQNKSTCLKDRGSPKVGQACENLEQYDEAHIAAA
jgi:outer membrane lipoprotein SlyB